MSSVTHEAVSIWSDTWYPLQFEKFAEKQSPQSCTVLGAPVVFWWDAQQWRALVDQCPHRMVPLSEGRVSESGDLECPYHGWTFRGCDGACTSIPQLDDDRKIVASRSRARALPVAVRDGIIWVWAAKLLGSSAEPDPDTLESLLVEPIGKPGVLHTDYFRDLWMDATILCENVLDPSHLPFTHHETISKRERAGPLTCKLATEIERGGFSGSKGSPSSQGGTLPSSGSVAFTAPHHVLTTTTRPSAFSDWNVVYVVPVAPGRSRLFVRVVFEVSRMAMPLGLIFSVAFRQPDALLHLSNHKILEDDNVFLHMQDIALRSDTVTDHEPDAAGAGFLTSSKRESEDGGSALLAPRWQKRLHLPAKADAFVVAYRLWLDKYTAGAGAAWSPFCVQGRASNVTPQRQKRSVLLERLESHTDKCAPCSQLRGRALAVQKLSVISVLGLLLVTSCSEPSMLRSGMAILTALDIAAFALASVLIDATETGPYPPRRNR